MSSVRILFSDGISLTVPVKGAPAGFRVKIATPSTDYDLGLVRATFIAITERCLFHPSEIGGRDFDLAATVAKVFGDVPIVFKGRHSTMTVAHNDIV